jgi:ribosomal protein S18 acetylase RimI-like enzyme
MPTAEVRSAREDERQSVIDVITLAFSTDPMARWAYPHPATYLAAMPKTIEAFGGNGFAHGTVYLADGGAAASMWLPPGVESDAEQLAALSEQYSPPERLPEMMQVFERMSEHHPNEPCWFLPLIGVDPTSQGRGYGSALLRHALDQCDRDNVAAYLESSNPRNIPLYERHGFKVLGSIQAGSSPTLVPMLRRPKR